MADVRCKVLRNFVYQGKDMIKGDVVVLDENDAYEFLIKGHLQIFDEKKGKKDTTPPNIDK